MTTFKISPVGDPGIEADAIQFFDTKDGVSRIMQFMGRKAVRVYGDEGKTIIGFDGESLAPGQWLVKDASGKFFIWDSEPFNEAFCASALGE